MRKGCSKSKVHSFTNRISLLLCKKNIVENATGTTMLLFYVVTIDIDVLVP